MKKDNPFTLTFGKQPTEYISRYDNTETVVSTFMADHPVVQAYLIEGVRGTGKTVLMTAITRELAELDEWIIIDLNSTQDLLMDLAVRLSDACRKLPDLVETGFNISIAGFGVGINGSTQPRDNISAIEDVLTELRKKHKRVCITIDEVMHDQNMRQFASQFQIFLRKEYPVFLLMTGLYETIHSIQNDPALTFLLRTPRIRLEPLSLPQITKQYTKVFGIEIELAGKLARITKGYAFAFQALGMLYFEYADSLSLGDILSKMDDMLDDFVYRKIWESLSGQERAIVLCLTEEEIKVTKICQKLEMTSATFSRYRDRLIKKGILTAVRHGYVALTLPRFSEIAAMYVL